MIGNPFQMKTRASEKRTECFQLKMPPSLKREMDAHVASRPVRSVNEWLLQLIEHELAATAIKEGEKTTEAA